MKTRIKIQGFLIFLAVIALVFLHKYLFSLPQATIGQLFLNIFALVFILWGYLLRISARGVKAELNPDGKTLVTRGPYALLRNPMYFGTLLIGLGVILALFHWWVTAIFLIIYLLIYIPQINREETVLSGRFGQVFRDYCQKTPQFFPKPDSLIKFPQEFFRIKAGWIKKELSSIILTIVFTCGIKTWVYLAYR